MLEIDARVYECYTIVTDLPARPHFVVVPDTVAYRSNPLVREHVAPAVYRFSDSGECRIRRIAINKLFKE